MHVTAAERLIQASLIGEALDNGPVLVFVADEHMRYAAVNAFACDALGYTREALLGMRVTDICTYPEAPADYAGMIGDRSQDGEAVLTRRDGTSFRIRYVAGETRVAGMPFYISVGRIIVA
jgi:PAS domain S-box-containing protein